MANTDTPMGFVPYRHLSGGVVRESSYKIQSGYATNLFRGDAVVLTSGFVERAADNSSTILGIFQGVRYRDTNGEVIFSPRWIASTTTLASEDAVAIVIDDENVSFKVQCDTGTDYVDATHKGTSVDIELDHAGSATTGQSGMEIDLADTGQTQFLVLGLIDEPGNAAGAHAMVEVKMRKSLLNLA